MAFGNISTLYVPTAGLAGASQWGTDVRKLLSSADPDVDATSITDHSTGAAVTRTVDPYTTKATDDTQANFGWAITPTDMNSVAGARRFYPAGSHTVSVRMGHSGATAATGTLTMYVYRVGPAPTRTRTLLGSNTGSVALPTLGGDITATVTVALGEVIFEADETIQYSWEFNVAGIPITGRTATFYTGTHPSQVTQIATPKLGVLADTTGTATGSGVASGTSGKVLGTTGTTTGAGTATGVGASTATTTGTASATSTVVGQGSSVAGTTGSASGSGTATGQASIVLGTTGTVEIGAGGSEPVIETTVIFAVLD